MLNFFKDKGSYEDLSEIGNGAYGTVYRAKNRSSDQVVAMKKIRVPLADDGVPMSTLREISLLRHLDQYEHPNIVRLLDICQGKKLDREQHMVLFMVFEHMEYDLARFLDSIPNGLSLSKIVSIMKDIFSGVDFLHSRRVVHRDLKPQNLLVTKTGRIKIADFGLAKTYDFEMRLTSVVVTLWYRAPEVILGMPYATSIDIWSCGCILAELFKRLPLFCGTSEADQLDRILRIIGTPPKHDWPENVSILWSSFESRKRVPFEQIIPNLTEPANDLLKKTLCFKSCDRLSAKQCLNHPFFHDFV